MGIPGDAETRRARMAAHAALDSLRVELGWSKAQSYRWLSECMNISPKGCHIGCFNKQQCEQVVNLCDAARPRPIVGPEA